MRGEGCPGSRHGQGPRRPGWVLSPERAGSGLGLYDSWPWVALGWVLAKERSGLGTWELMKSCLIDTTIVALFKFGWFFFFWCFAQSSCLAQNYSGNLSRNSRKSPRKVMCIHHLIIKGNQDSLKELPSCKWRSLYAQHPFNIPTVMILRQLKRMYLEQAHGGKFLDLCLLVQ